MKAKGPRRVLVIAGIALASVLAYVVGQSAVQLRGLLSSSTSAAASGGPEDDASLDAPTATVLPSAAVDRAGAEEVDVEETKASAAASVDESSSDAGPPTGAEFAHLLEEGLVEDADSDAVEAYLRALREADAPP